MPKTMPNSQSSRNPHIPIKPENCHRVNNEDGNLAGRRTITEIQIEIEYLWQDICQITQYQLKPCPPVPPNPTPRIFITSPTPSSSNLINSL
jgi:hypothetical protein